MTLLSSEPNASASFETADDSLNSRRQNSRYEDAFNRLTEAVGDRLSSSAHHFSLSLAAEDSQFTRFNRAKVRQTGQVRDGQLRLTLMTDQQTTAANVPFTGEFETDWAVVEGAITALQKDLSHLPPDPYVVLPEASNQGRSREVRSGKLPQPNDGRRNHACPSSSPGLFRAVCGGEPATGPTVTRQANGTGLKRRPSRWTTLYLEIALAKPLKARSQAISGTQQTIAKISSPASSSSLC